MSHKDREPAQFTVELPKYVDRGTQGSTYWVQRGNSVRQRLCHNVQTSSADFKRHVIDPLFSSCGTRVRDNSGGVGRNHGEVSDERDCSGRFDLSKRIID